MPEAQQISHKGKLTPRKSPDSWRMPLTAWSVQRRVKAGLTSAGFKPRKQAANSLTIHASEWALKYIQISVKSVFTLQHKIHISINYIVVNHLHRSKLRSK